MNVFTLLIQATALMAALMLLRPLLKRWLSARARRALWFIPAARLLFPFEIKSAFSIMAPVQPVSTGLSEAVSRPTGIEPPSWLGSGIGVMESNVYHSTVPALPDPGTAAVSSGFAIGDILIALWLIGSAVTAGIIIYRNIKFSRAAKRIAEPMGDGFGLPVYLVRGLPSPCLAGIFRPVIYINELSLTSDEVLEMTVRHELTHYKRLDHIWGGVRAILLALYWFHPLVWLSAEMFRADCETACDEAATLGMDKDERESYGMALITLASRGKGGAGSLMCFSTMNGGKKLLYERISRLAGTKTLRHAALIAVMLAAVLCFTMCTVPQSGGEDSLPPPSPTPGFMGEEPLASESDESPMATTEPVPMPAMGEEGTLEDMAYFLELAANTEFELMDMSMSEEIFSEYGSLLDDFRFITRVSTDGRYAYIAGEYMGNADNNPLRSLYSVEMNYADSEEYVQVLYNEAQQDWVERSIAASQLPMDTMLLHNSRIYWHPDSPLIIIEAYSAEDSLTVGYSRYLSGQRAYIADAVERGIALTRPDGPYLEVYLISEKWGEISERIPLTEAEAEAIASEELTEIIPGFGFSAALYYDNNHTFYNENRGIPQTVLDLAVEKCDYRFGDPGMITAPITEAKLECSWLTEPLYADEADLARLESILKNAQFGYVGACGYGAKLTVRMGNEMVTMFKGTDGCDTIVFGSYSGYFLGDAENTEFWEIFGLDAESKMPKAPSVILNTVEGTVQLFSEDAQFLYNIISSAVWLNDTPACDCDYGFTVLDAEWPEEYIYHSECGTIINTDNNKAISLDESTMESLNAILSKYRTR